MTCTRGFDQLGGQPRPAPRRLACEVPSVCSVVVCNCQGTCCWSAWFGRDGDFASLELFLLAIRRQDWPEFAATALFLASHSRRPATRLGLVSAAAVHLAPYSGRPNTRSGLVAASAVYLAAYSGRPNTRSGLLVASADRFLLIFARKKVKRCKRREILMPTKWCPRASPCCCGPCQLWTTTGQKRSGLVTAAAVGLVSVAIAGEKNPPVVTVEGQLCDQK